MSRLNSCSNCMSLGWGPEEGLDKCEKHGTLIPWADKRVYVCPDHVKSPYDDPREKRFKIRAGLLEQENKELKAEIEDLRKNDSRGLLWLVELNQAATKRLQLMLLRDFELTSTLKCGLWLITLSVQYEQQLNSSMGLHQDGTRLHRDCTRLHRDYILDPEEVSISKLEKMMENICEEFASLVHWQNGIDFKVSQERIINARRFAFKP